MKCKLASGRHFMLIGVIASAWVCGSFARAATIQWTGNAGDGLWSNTNNWEHFILPGAGDTVEFGDTATNGAHTVIVDGAYTNLLQIIFSGGGDRQFTLTAADEDAVLAASSSIPIDLTSNLANDVELAVKFGFTTRDEVLFRNNSAHLFTISSHISFIRDEAGGLYFTGGRFALNHPQDKDLAFRNRIRVDCDELLFLEGYGVNTTFPRDVRLIQAAPPSSSATVRFTNPAIFNGTWWSVFRDGPAYVGLMDAGPDDVTITVSGRAGVRIAGFEADWPNAVLRFLDNDENSQGRFIFNLSGNQNHYLPLDTRSNTVIRFSASGAHEMTFHNTGDARPSMVIGGDGSLWKSGAGTLTVRSDNTYRGRTMLSGGTLKLDTFTYNDNTYTGQLPADTIVEIGAGATLDLNGIHQTVGGLADWTGLDQTNAPTAGSVALGGATLTVNAAQASSFRGQISGAGALVKTGDEAFTLAAGYTNAVGRTLRVAGGLFEVSGALTIEEGTFELAGGFIGAGTLSSTGMTWNVTLFDGYEGQALVSAESADITGAGLVLSLADGYAPAIETQYTLLTVPTGTIAGDDLFGYADDDTINVDGTLFQINRVPGSESIVLTVIPEPGVLALLALAAAGLWVRRRRERGLVI